MAIRGKSRLLFTLFFALAVVLAGGIGRIGVPVLAGRADALMLTIFILALTGLTISLLIVARILYIMSWRPGGSPPRMR